MSAHPYLSLSKPLQDISQYNKPNCKILWDNVNLHIIIIDNHTVHIAPIYHTISSIQSDEEFNLMIEDSSPTISTVQYVVYSVLFC
jgi:hypothetical protein